MPSNGWIVTLRLQMGLSPDRYDRHNVGILLRVPKSEGRLVVPFGAWLKRERERQGVSLDEISMSTKIGTRFLRALEDEHFDQLPGGIFNKAFVKAYARQVGVDEEEAVASYLEAIGETAVQPVALQPSEPENDGTSSISEMFSGTTRIPWRASAALLILVVSVLAFWHFHSSHESKVPAENPVSSTALKQNATSEPEPAAVKSAVGEKNSRPAIPNPVKPKKVLVAQDPLPQTPTAAPGEFSLIIKAKEDCWLLITADGKQVLQDTLGASAEKLVAARSEITLKAGNVGALELWFNGKKLPAIGDYEEVKTIAFNSNGLLPMPAKLAPAAIESQP